MSWKPNQDLKSFDKVPSVSTQASSPPNVENLNDATANKERSKNRSKDVRRDKDTVKDFTVTFEDIDKVVLNHLNGLKISVLNEGKTTDVPVFYASPERWKSIQQDGFLRDHKGQIQLPAVAVRRGTTQRNESLRIFNRYGEHLSMPFIRKYSHKNAYDRFSVTSCLGIQHQPVHEVHNVNLPDHYIIQYPCIVWTDRIDQNNKIVERIAYSTEDYWGDSRYFKFRSTVTDFDLQTDIQDGSNRMVRSTFNLQLYAYLLPEYYKDWKSTTIKTLTPRKILWGPEIEPTKEVFDEDYVIPQFEWPSGSI
jgi:hypothetical protein